MKQFDPANADINSLFRYALAVLPLNLKKHCFLVVLTFFFALLALPFHAQQTICLTENEIEAADCGVITQLNTTGPYYVRIYVYVIRDGNGNGGQTPEQVREAVEYLHQDFREHNIFFVWDCHINYINNQSHFDKVAGDPAVFLPTDANGIRIYLFPDHPWPVANGSGKAISICGEALYVSGNYFNTPYGSLVRSHVLSHEMGHCLGLWQTFANPSQYVNDSNCSIHGDYVCDTPADPNMNHQVDPVTCQYQQVIYDQNGVLYDPDEANIMAYTHPECMQHFSSGQGQRMRDAIAQSDLLQLFLVDFDFNDVTIGSQIPTVWSVANYPGGIDIAGDVTINGAATLTIEAGVEVRFTETGRLIIKQGGTLNLYGKLTGQCGKTWQGVEVWGDPTKSQYPDPTSLPHVAQGQLIASGTQSCIENADIAVKVYGPALSKGGGIVICSGTTFLNNRIGVRFAPYENKHPYLKGKKVDNISKFTGCFFLTDEFYLHKSKFHAFLDFDQVRGIDISGCRFINTRTPPNCTDYVEFGYGIYSYNAGFKVHNLCQGAGCIPQPSRFDGLAYGIYAAEIPSSDIPSQSKPYTVTQSVFTNCFVGLHHREASTVTITYNDFLLGDLPLPINGLIDGQIGLAIEGNVVGITVEENEFNGDPAATWPQFGTIATNLGARNQVIRRNAFTHLTYSNTAYFQNANNNLTPPRGLLYECNSNSATEENDFTVDGKIRFVQGRETDDTSNPSYIAAGNTFAASANYHWSVTGSNIRYFYNDQALAEVPDPNKITVTVDLQDADPNTCEIQIPDESNPEFLANVENVKAQYYLHKVSYQKAKAAYDAALAAYTPTFAATKSHEAAYHRLEMDFAAAKVLRWLLLDTLQTGRDSVRTWMLHLDAYEGDLALAKDYLTTGEAAQALNALDAAAAKYGLNAAQTADLAEIRDVFVMTITQAGAPYSQAQLERLEEIAGSPETGYAHAMARNILTRYGAHYPPYFYLPGGERQAKPEVKQQYKARDMGVYPNPADQYVLFVWSNIQSSGILIITDLNGKIMLHAPLQPGQFSLDWDTHNIASGLYFYQYCSKTGDPESGKIVIHH